MVKMMNLFLQKSILAKVTMNRRSLCFSGNETHLPNEDESGMLVINDLNSVKRAMLKVVLLKIFNTMNSHYDQVCFKLYLSDEDVGLSNIESPGMPMMAYVPYEIEFLDCLLELGLYGVEVAARADMPLLVLKGVEIREYVVKACRGKQGECFDHNQAVIYKGPWSEIRDDDGHVYRRGVRTAVCLKTFNLLQCLPYRDHFIPITPYHEVVADEAQLFDCKTPAVRSSKVTKGSEVMRKREQKICNGNSGCC